MADDFVAFRCKACGAPMALSHRGVDTMASALTVWRAENEKLRVALLRIVRESHDGEAMATAAEALGVPFDRTEPASSESRGTTDE